MVERSCSGQRSNAAAGAKELAGYRRVTGAAPSSGEERHRWGGNVQSRETARKCRECADSALALAREAQTARDVRHYLRLAEIWLRLAARFDRCHKQARSPEDELLFLLFQETPPAVYPDTAAEGASATDVP